VRWVFERYKPHVVSDIATAIRLLSGNLRGKVRDDRFFWAKP
jgi:hypothetical protein